MGYCITSSTRSMSVRISWMVWPAPMSVPAGSMKAVRKPWNTVIMPRVKRPSMAKRTPRNTTV